MSSKKTLRFAISSALLVGSVSACGGNEPQVNQAAPLEPEVNEAHDPVTDESAPAEDGMQSNEIPPEEEPTLNVLQALPPTE